ncbi:MAG TPA: chlorite dismutase family protein [Ktedonobacterales bacterium]|nr:chlorite dismutase family protein [Ktedonobacterales bacterium]
MPTTSSPSNVFVAYWLYQADPAFGRLEEGRRRRAKASFLDALERRPKSVTLRGVYSLAGLREDADLMLWAHGPELDDLQRLAVSLRQSDLGRYLIPRQVYIGVTAAARYDPGHQPSFMYGAAPKRYISVYPFVKTTEWYLLPYEQRRELMAEHGLVGRKYAVSRERLLAEREEGAGGTANADARAAATALATDEEGGGVLSNTVDSFGLGDYEFILANESDDPAELCRMMESLRKVEVRRYTKQDTPIFLGRLCDPAEALEDL